jgi:hypothetical protein
LKDTFCWAIAQQSGQNKKKKEKEKKTRKGVVEKTKRKSRIKQEEQD